MHPRVWTRALAGTHPHTRRISAVTFYHPDYTVGPGVSPDRGWNSDEWRVTSDEPKG